MTDLKTPEQTAELEQTVEDAINDIVDCYHPQLDSNTVLESQDAAAREVLLRYFGRISAAARAQGDAQGHERGLRHAAPIQRQAEADHVRALNAERRFDTLAAAARLARAVLDDTHASNEEMLDAIHVLDAALGPAPAPEEKS